MCANKENIRCARSEILFASDFCAVQRAISLTRPVLAAILTEDLQMIGKIGVFVKSEFNNARSGVLQKRHIQ